MANLADLLVHIGVDADDLTSGIESAVSSVEDNIGKIGAAGAVAGAGLEAFARGQAPLRESAARIAAATGEEASAINDLAREASNVTFPLDEVYASMESGRQQGLRSGEQLQEFATFWDMVGDATGESGPALADAGVALRAVGIAAGDEAQALSALGFVTQETTSSTADFLGFLDRTGPELRDMGASVDDAAAIMGVLESELGMSGRTARTEFRKAINESDGTMQGMLDTLGVSTEQFDEYTGKVADSSGVIQRNADIHADSYTAMQKAQHWASELMNAHSGLFDMASSLAMPLIALGPISKGVTMAFRGIVTGIPALVSGLGAAATAVWAKVTAMVSWAATTVAQGARAVASLAVTAGQFVAHYTRMAAAALAQAARMAASWVIAMGPVGWVIAAVVALVALIVANWDTVVAWTKKAWTWVTDKIGAAWRWIKDTTSSAVASVVSFFVNLRNRAVSTVTNLRDRVVSFFTNIRDRVVSAASRLAIEAVAKFVALKEGAIDKARQLLDYVRNLPGNLVRAIGSVHRLLLDKGKDIVRGLWDGIKGMGSWLWNKLTSFVTDNIPGPIAKALGISSPSTVAAALAREVPRGMVAGIDGEASQLRRAAERMALDALPELGVPRIPSLSAAGSGTSAGRQQTIVIELDGREIGRAVAPVVASETRVRTGVRR